MDASALCTRSDAETTAPDPVIIPATESGNGGAPIPLHRAWSYPTEYEVVDWRGKGPRR